MADADLIAWVYPYEDDRYGYAEDAIKSNSRSMPPRRPRQRQRQPQQARLSRRSRESTIPPEDRKKPSLDELPYLKLRFKCHGRAETVLDVADKHAWSCINGRAWR